MYEFQQISLYFNFTEIPDKTERLHALKEIVKKFHPVNYDVFRYVITHLNRYFYFLFLQMHYKFQTSDFLREKEAD